MSMAIVTAVCVAYNPEPGQLAHTLAATVPQVSRLLVMDNSDADATAVREVAQACGAEYCWMRGNWGLAGALNAGIERALALGSSHVLLLDQDSLPAPDMVSCLLSAEREHQLTDRPPAAALGPDYQDPRAGRATTYPRFRHFPPQRVIPEQEPPVFEVDMLISSGSLISRAALETIGTMDAGLFIDHIDTDWCLRATAAGFTLHVVKAAKMRHGLGSRWVSLGGRYSLPLHDADRLYYQFRNSLRLYRRAHAVWPWIVSDLRRLLVVFGLHLLAADERVRAMRMIAGGVIAGLLDRSGARTPAGPEVSDAPP